MNKELFNIYYINISKVYELAMILNNRVLNSLIKENVNGSESERKRKSNLSANYMNMFGAEIGEDNNIKKYKSSKVIESLEVKTTKSILLRNILDECKIINKNTKMEVGDLVHIDKISLSLENEAELRTIKLIKNKAIDGIKYEGIDLNNLFNSILNDHSYTLTGKSDKIKNNILIKIPMMYENEFENLYTINDLLIGNVSLIGIYRGKTKKDELRDNLKAFNETGSITPEENNNFDFENSDVELETSTTPSSNDNYNYDFIDIISIIQNVNPNVTKKKCNTPIKKDNIFSKIKNWFKKKDKNA